MNYSYYGKMYSFGHVAKTIRDEAETHSDQIILKEAIEFIDLETVRLDGQPHPLNERAQRMICTRFHIPFNYMTEWCDADTQRENLNHRLGEEVHDRLYFRFRGETVRAMFSPRFQPMDNRDVVEKLEGMGFAGNTKVRARIDDDFFNLQIPIGDDDFDVNGGDRYKAGVSVQNSEVGLSCLAVAPFVLRLVCTNGLVRWERGERDAYRHISRVGLEHFDTVFWAAAEKFELTLDGLSAAGRQKIEDPEKYLEGIGPRFNLTGPEREAIQRAWPQEQGDNLRNIIETVTRAANDKEITAESSNRLQRTAGNILALS